MTSGAEQAAAAARARKPPTTTTSKPSLFQLAILAFKLRRISTMNRDQVLSILRQALVFVGGYVVAKGWIDNETMLAIAGALATLGSAIWALWTHSGATKQAALNVATGTGTGKEIAAVEKTTGKTVR